MEEKFTGMHELVDAIEAAIASAPLDKRRELATAIDAYAEDCPDEYFWAIGAQAPTLLGHLLMGVDLGCRTERQALSPERENQIH